MSKNFLYCHEATLSIKIIEWPRQIDGHSAANEILCPMKESSCFYCHSIFLGKSRDMYDLISARKILWKQV